MYISRIFGNGSFCQIDRERLPPLFPNISSTFCPKLIQFTSLSLAARSLYNLESYNDNTLTCHKNKYFDIAYHLHAYALETTNPA